jgi:hypothetical protein
MTYYTLPVGINLESLDPANFSCEFYASLVRGSSPEELFPGHTFSGDGIPDSVWWHGREAASAVTPNILYSLHKSVVENAFVSMSLPFYRRTHHFAGVFASIPAFVGAVPLLSIATVPLAGFLVRAENSILTTPTGHSLWLHSDAKYLARSFPQSRDEALAGAATEGVGYDNRVQVDTGDRIDVTYSDDPTWFSLGIRDPGNNTVLKWLTSQNSQQFEPDYSWTQGINTAYFREYVDGDQYEYIPDEIPDYFESMGYSLLAPLAESAWAARCHFRSFFYFETPRSGMFPLLFGAAYPFLRMPLTHLSSGIPRQGGIV